MLRSPPPCPCWQIARPDNVSSLSTLWTAMRAARGSTDAPNLWITDPSETALTSTSDTPKNAPTGCTLRAPIGPKPPQNRSIPLYSVRCRHMRLGTPQIPPA